MRNIKILLNFLLFAFAIAFLACSSSSQKIVEPTERGDNRIFSLSFDDNKLGKYTQKDLTESIGKLEWAIIDNRAEIVQDKVRGKVLKVHYPKGAVGPRKGGIQFNRTFKDVDSCYLDYYIKFDDKFDFVLGGKLPGLTSGGEKYTGGIHPSKGEGWSARYMWLNRGAIVVYFYYLDMKSKWGDALNLYTRFESGRWYRITQYIKINSEDKFDGEMRVWIDGESVLVKNDVRYRIAPLGRINSFYFSTFFGGASADWAPKKDEAIFFDDIVVSLTKPKKLDQVK